MLVRVRAKVRVRVRVKGWGQWVRVMVRRVRLPGTDGLIDDTLPWVR